MGSLQMDYTDTLALRLRRLRLRRDLSQATLAERIGVSRPTIWSWEKGKSLPKGLRILALAEALQVAESELILEEPERSETLDQEIARSKKMLLFWRAAGPIRSRSQLSGESCAVSSVETGCGNLARDKTAACVIGAMLGFHRVKLLGAQIVCRDLAIGEPGKAPPRKISPETSPGENLGGARWVTPDASRVAFPSHSGCHAVFFVTARISANENDDPGWRVDGPHRPRAPR